MVKQANDISSDLSFGLALHVTVDAPPPPDGGPDPGDAYTRPPGDAGATVTQPPSEGCGCTTTGDATALLGGVVLLALFRRRRRRI